MTIPATWSPTDDPDQPDADAILPTTEGRSHLMVVPRTAGPVLDVDAVSTGIADELDAAIDDLFGEPTDEPAGPVDAILVLGGIGLTAWSIATGAPGPVLAIGVGAALLGVALPAHAVAATARERRRASARARLIGDGLAIDVVDPTVRSLVDAYGACLAAASAPGLPYARDAAEAAHLAVVEVASLLAGGRPIAAAEVEYVRKRTEAIERLRRRLRWAHRHRVEARLDASIHRASPEQARALALVEAREELEATDGLGSLARLDAVGSVIEGGDPDARR